MNVPPSYLDELKPNGVDRPPPWDLPPVEVYENDAATVTTAEPEAGHGHTNSIQAQRRKHELAAPYETTELGRIIDKPSPAVVQGMIPESSVTAIVGVPNSGKTAFAIDLCVHVAVKAPWFGRKVAGGPVIYVAAEAPGSCIMRARAAADRRFHGQRVPLYLAEAAPALGSEVVSLVEAERLIATIRSVESAEGEAVRLLVVDTLASCLGDGDENGDGMIRLVGAAKHIAHQTSVPVVLVHHPSKGDAAGLRGHGSLAAACDTIVAITMDELTGIRTATLVKSRDSATGLQLHYELEVVGLPDPDAFGDTRTTIVVKPATVTQRQPRPGGKQQQALLVELERRYRTGEKSWDEATIRKAGRDLGMPRNSPADALRGLQTAGFVTGSAAHLLLKYPPDDTP